MSRTRRGDPEAGAPDGPTTLSVGASVAFLTGLAVTFPVLEVLGSNPEFFIARATPTADALMVALTFGLLVPAALSVTVAATAAAHRGVGLLLHGAVAGVLVGLFVYDAASRAVGPGAVAGVGALVVAGALVVGFWRFPPAWSVVRWGAAVPVFALALFVLVWPTSRVVVGGGDVGSIDIDADGDVPVTVVVFDELSTASLLRGPDEIDAERFPNLAAFAEDAVWYRNATTVSDSTTLAVPAVFTGRRTGSEQLPVAADHPVSLFTLLGDTHDVRAVEPVTELCPPSVCEAAGGSGPAGVRSLASDVSLVGAHVLLPATLTQDLPRIDQGWGDFGLALEADPREPPEVDGHDLVSRMNESVARDRRDDFQDVVAPSGGQAAAHLLHTLLPHVPYRLLPSGQAVHPTPMAGVGPDEVWEDGWLARHAAARYLLQLGFVDRMLGGLLADLEAAGVYDDGLVIVTSDHGVSFEEGTTRRRLSADNVAQVAAVPLLVKYPHDPGGRIDRRPAETIDIVPTVLDVLGATPPEGIDGTSLLTTGSPATSRTADGFHGPVTFTVEDADPWSVGRTYREVFGDGWDGVYVHGPHTGLVGRSLDELPVSDTGSFIGSVDRLDEIRAARPTDDPIVGVVSGGLGYRRDPGEERFVAVAFDGRVVAVGRTYEHEPDRAPFLALVAPGGYAGGVDEVTLHTLEPGPDGLTLAPVLLP